MGIYTRKGDKGRTKLFGGRAISKASERVEAYGEVDELNAVLGVVATQVEDAALLELIQHLQNDLHLVCADLANPDLKRDTHRINAAHVEVLEKHCDELEAKQPPLKKFVLPGGSTAGSTLHFARTVARRAERRAVHLAENESVNPEVIRYLNRLSDLLFLMALEVNRQSGIKERNPDY
ncbi:MAG: cob(I)yrinic acid a,c-diamide adenosyltransferase [Candidatus Latescibacteria bacterium]|nr:cob(I)yrinic acid a,c-diamide adenosyltransferase [Candidatus Latescibacterota bacterium]NIM22715.1 cob(I)yrinic acid a,c-diamide adenosyltransferase [Candidatus Latescibacterota bacterium]NIM65004.1 cob(I)yrinic acid a,c-diamide adenosyltransferase [Candidatus Latescibacterota bacterium]NIO01519.1 cob(I)yrinic acid a,c-diamide adenosyltransferase [Candidatus Latescibacterota bacterium]NIO28028.1 cob(I)yrinic acid a,c-diamide adenosyltransferase [Candidatus Latescibacterota bacterium]